MRVSILIVAGILTVVSMTSCTGQNIGSQSTLKGWGAYTDGTNKFALKFPSGWSVGIEDRKLLKGNEAVSFASPANLPSFNVTIHGNPKMLSPREWFKRSVKEAGEGWGGEDDIVAEHEVTICGQTGYTALMDMPDSKVKFTYFAWSGRIFEIDYDVWWTSMTAYEQRHYKNHCKTLDLILQTIRPVDLTSVSTQKKGDSK